MTDKEILEMLVNLRRNSRRSLAASEVVKEDTKCAKTLRNIITSSGTITGSLAASAAIPNHNRNVNRVKTLYDFVITNHLR